MTWIRGGLTCLDASNIIEAIDNRLVALLNLFEFTLNSHSHSYDNFFYLLVELHNWVVVCRVKLITFSVPIILTTHQFIRSRADGNGQVILIVTCSLG